jgi:hypothetical protein
MILRLALISALSFMGELQSPFIWDIGGHSTLIFSGPSRSTSIRCAFVKEAGGVVLPMERAFHLEIPCYFPCYQGIEKPRLGHPTPRKRR